MQTHSFSLSTEKKTFKYMYDEQRLLTESFVLIKSFCVVVYITADMKEMRPTHDVSVMSKLKSARDDFFMLMRKEILNKVN